MTFRVQTIPEPGSTFPRCNIKVKRNNFLSEKAKKIEKAPNFVIWRSEEV